MLLNRCCGESDVIGKKIYNDTVQKEIILCKPNPVSEQISSTAQEYTGSFTCNRRFKNVEVFHPGIWDPIIEQDINGDHVANISDNGQSLTVRFSGVGKRLHGKKDIFLQLPSEQYCVRIIYDVN